MDDSEVRLRLLEDELGALHSGVAAYDSRIAQVKGWCITVVSGLVALAITQGQMSLALCSIASLGAFWLADSHLASIQRVMIRRLQAIEAHFRGRSPLTALCDDTLALPGLSAEFVDPPQVTGWWAEVRFEMTAMLREAVSPYRLFFYVLMLAGVALVIGTFAIHR